MRPWLLLAVMFCVGDVFAGPDRARAMVVFDPTARSEALALVSTLGGRVIATFREPAVIAVIDDEGARELQRALRRGMVALGPVDDPTWLARAPSALGFWNRQLGLSSGEPDLSGFRQHPKGQPRRLAPQKAQVAISPELDRAGRETGRKLLRCFATGSRSCAGALADSSRRAELDLIFAHEIEVVRRRGIDVERYELALLGFDGAEARYEVTLTGRPTGALSLIRRGDSFVVRAVDP
ncbi:MAG: hypothetical protein HY791_13115 [Deltaproteobacteria bacterium]|nr:hypothetical protein [Deltaproteobacteria bacterium]